MEADFEKVEPLKISEIRKIADMAPEIHGQPDYEKIKTIDMEKLIEERDVRLQRLMFTAAVNVYNQMNCDWKNRINKEFAFSQLVGIVDEFLQSDKFQIEPISFQEDETKRKLPS